MQYKLHFSLQILPVQKIKIKEIYRKLNYSKGVMFNTEKNSGNVSTTIVFRSPSFIFNVVSLNLENIVHIYILFKTNKSVF